MDKDQNYPMVLFERNSEIFHVSWRAELREKARILSPRASRVYSNKYIHDTDIPYCLLVLYPNASFLEHLEMLILGRIFAVSVVYADHHSLVVMVKVSISK